MNERWKARLEYLRPLRRAGKLGGWAFREWLLLEKCAANEAEREPQERQLAASGRARAWAYWRRDWEKWRRKEDEAAWRRHEQRLAAEREQQS
jgi:hypothetical protein